MRELAGGPVDFVFDAPPPYAGAIPELIAITGDPHRVMTSSNHDEARRLGARVSLDHATDPVPAATFLPEYAALAADGVFTIPIARTYPLGDWRSAVELGMSGHPRGKLVLLPEQNTR
ncbi:zinc-binding dehydrogenase [Amycolatopsis sp. NPDC059027]|uniref:zinc-binding dehydrogenase n=1 Tax=Amycolatopsis sp. NPDC059027 TaxID=3346709 RepID=UPI00366B8AE2